MEQKIKKYRYSELFGGHGFTDETGKFHPGTIQGEGIYTGITSVWLRLWGCNKECSGFGQHNPTDPSSYDLDFQKVDVSKYNTLDELPVFEKGCDSSYSWAAKFMHLAHKDSAEEIVNKIRQRLVNGKFRHPLTNQPCHMVFTGGEPILSQHALVAVMEEFMNQNEVPEFVTIETNGSLEIREDFINLFTHLQKQGIKHSTGGSGKNELFTEYKGRVYPLNGFKELFWSVSPKIYSTSGESFESSILPEVVKQYYDLSPRGQFKFVCNGTQQSWDEIDLAVEMYREAGIPWDIWIMPVGATVEGQKLVDADVADGAIHRGYYVSARVHTYLYGNTIGR